jgi:hypothetical protein
LRLSAGDVSHAAKQITVAVVMQTELNQLAVKLHPRRGCHVSTRTRRPLEPLAVDAALSDESLVAAEDQDDELLDSLSKQLDLLQEQEQQIRRLLARAGYVRIDSANA